VVTAAALCLVGCLHTVPGIVVGWGLTQVGVNAMQAGLAAAVPDRVPVGQRATAPAGSESHRPSPWPQPPRW
jgi:hypothetical protein